MSNHLAYDQLSEETGIPVGTLYHWVRQRRIPHRRFGPRTVRFEREAINEWLRTHEINAATRAAR